MKKRFITSKMITDFEVDLRNDEKSGNTIEKYLRDGYRVKKDIAKLANILDHNSINTTRIYIITTSAEHRRKLENMRFII